MYKYENLNQSNRLAHLWNRCKAGLRSIPESPARSALTALYWFTALLLLLHAAGPADGIIGHLMQPLVCILVVLGSIIFFVTGVTIAPGKRGRKGVIPLMPDENSFDTFGYSDYQMLNYWEHSPTWEDLFGDDFTDDLLDEDELDEAEADTDHSGEQAQ